MLTIAHRGAGMLTADELARLLDALSYAPAGFRDMALGACGRPSVDDNPDGWIGLTPAQAHDVGQTALRRFAPRDDRRAA